MTAPAQRPGSIPAWVNRLFGGLVVYALVASLWMLIGIGGPTITHYVGLLSDIPAAIVSVIIVAATSRHAPRGPLRAAWVLLASALAVYVIAISIGAVSWLNGRDPFPGRRISSTRPSTWSRRLRRCSSSARRP